uniref:Uncharacterized protein MANES_17G016400 n=1 Tax=Rhizophora mucronata TaxID=61149 RepID=A0A2P2J4C4_RHIMU
MHGQPTATGRRDSRRGHRRPILRWVPSIRPKGLPKRGPEFTETVTRGISPVILREVLSRFGLGLRVLIIIPEKLLITDSSNFNKTAPERRNLVRAEVVGGFAIGAKINRLIIAAVAIIGVIIIFVIKIGEVATGEEEIQLLGTPWAIGLRPNLSNFISIVVVPTAAVVPLVPFLNGHKRLSAAVAIHVHVVEVIQVRRNRGRLRQLVIPPAQDWPLLATPPKTAPRRRQ